MEEESWTKSRHDDGEFRSEDSLLPSDASEGGGRAEEEEEEEEDGPSRYSRPESMRSTLWVLLTTATTLAARGSLRNGFPYPFYFLMLLQLSAYVTAAVVVLLVKVAGLNQTPRAAGDRYTTLELLLIGFRILTSSTMAALGMLLAYQALFKFDNLQVLVMLPILTYVFDSVFFRLANAMHLIPRDQSLSVWRLYRVLIIPILLTSVVNEDYRLDKELLKLVIASFALASGSKVLSRIGPRINKGAQSWETALQLYLLAGIPPLMLAGLATYRYENMVAASHLAESWGIIRRIMTFVPGVVLQILYNSTALSAYPFMSREHIGGALEEVSGDGTDALASTLQTGLWILMIGVLGNERNFLNWIQVISITLVYLVSVGPKHIGYYPPRALNLVLRLLRRRSLPVRPEPWQFIIFLFSTTCVFAVLLSTQIMFWNDTIAYNHDVGNWLDPSNLVLDTMYHTPELRSFDVVIAHSYGDSVDTVRSLIDSFARLPHFNAMVRVKVYTQDSDFPLTEVSLQQLKGEFRGTLNVQQIRNTGGPTLAYLHHILYTYDAFPVHTLFLSTQSAMGDNTWRIINKLYNYYIQPDFPIPDAAPKTGFLNLGEVETCSCGNCFDASGWEDSFHLVPSMWAAARPGSKPCKSVLLTHGNNFIASAARIRGLKREVWQTLYDALVNPDAKNAWAHASEKMPKMLEGEEGKGRWAPDGVYGQPDTLERPYLGFTVERLWGVLLQCSSVEIAWRCPTMEVGLRRGGDKHDCGCID